MNETKKKRLAKLCEKACLRLRDKYGWEAYNRMAIRWCVWAAKQR